MSKSQITTRTQLDRLLAIDSLLSKAAENGNYVSFEKIHRILKEETDNPSLSESSVRRDLRYMRENLGAPIFYSKISGNEGYYYSEPFNFPAKALSNEDLISLALAWKILSRLAKRNVIYEKSAEILSKIFPAIKSVPLLDRIEISKWLVPSYNAELFNKIFEAVKNNSVITFKYSSDLESEKIRLTVLPYQIVIDESQIFLYAADENNESAAYLYSLARISDLQVLKNRNFTLPEKYFHFVKN